MLAVSLLRMVADGKLHVVYSCDAEARSFVLGRCLARGRWAPGEEEIQMGICRQFPRRGESHFDQEVEKEKNKSGEMQ